MLRKTWFAMAVAALFAGIVSATPIQGVLDISGTVRVYPTTIDWGSPYAVGVPPVMTDGRITVADTSTGYFQSLANAISLGVPVGAEYARSKDLDSMSQPVGVLFGDTNYLTGFSGLVTNSLTGVSYAGMVFRINYIYAGTYGAAGCGSSAPGAKCTPPVPGFTSPFEMENESSGAATAIRFTIAGTVVDTGNPTGFGNFIGYYKTTIAGKTIPQVLADLLTVGYVQSSYQASFNVTAVPEPGTLALSTLGISLLALCSVRRKK